MPFHDVSDGFDPSFWDEILVIHQRDDRAAFGRLQGTQSSPVVVDAVVESTGGQTTRDSDYQVADDQIRIFTMYRLNGPTPDNQSDIIVLDNQLLVTATPFLERYLANPSAYDHYVINNMSDFSRYGQGFVTVDCSITDPLPQPATG